MAYPSSSRTQWLSDVIRANAHAADARHEGSVCPYVVSPAGSKLAPRVAQQLHPLCYSPQAITIRAERLESHSWQTTTRGKAR
eukprot:2907360-Prymnesium_polylepis.1